MGEFDNKNEDVGYFVNEPEDEKSEQNQPIFRVRTIDESNQDDEFETAQTAETDEEDIENDVFEDGFSQDEFVEDEGDQEESNLDYKEDGVEIFSESDKTEVTSLKNRVLELIQSYKDVKKESERLRNEIVSLKAQNEALNEQLRRVEKEVIFKTTNEDDIIKQIEAVLSR